MGIESAPEMAKLGAAVAAQVEHQLSSAPLTGSYRDAARAALSLAGNILSPTPDLRWARPVVVCCDAVGGRLESGVHVAAAVEIFMVALDLLDDFEDCEKSELECRIGAPRALNVTTGLQFLAQQCLLEAADGATAARVLLDAGLRACCGQHADLGLACDSGTGLDDAWNIAAAKSGSLAAGICRLGALAADADAATQRLYARFGQLLGITAQLANDLRAISPAASGKTDILLRRATLPLVFASCTDVPVTGVNVESWSFGAIHFTWAVAETYRRRALDLIPALTSNRKCRADLASLLHVL
jgi:geranylgeranyl pyrophosphate synthase